MIPRADGEDPIARLERLVNDLINNSNQERTSVSYGLFRFIGGTLEGLANAVFKWVGSFDLTGPFTATGTSIFRGPVSITGENGTLDVEADAELKGDTKIGKTLDVTAETTLRALTKVLADLVVEAAGKVKVGTSMVLDPSVSAGAMVFSNGAQVFTDGGSIQLYLGNGVCQVENDRVKLQMGGISVVLDEDGVHVNGGPIEFQGRVTLQNAAAYAPNLPFKTGLGLPQGTLWADGDDDNRLYYVVN